MLRRDHPEALLQAKANVAGVSETKPIPALLSGRKRLPAAALIALADHSSQLSQHAEELHSESPCRLGLRSILSGLADRRDRANAAASAVLRPLAIAVLVEVRPAERHSLFTLLIAWSAADLANLRRVPCLRHYRCLGLRYRLS
jgi:hypothetical protein